MRMRKVFVFGLTYFMAGASLYACSDNTDDTEPTIPEVDASPGTDARSNTFGDTFVPDSRTTEDSSMPSTDSGPKADSGADAAKDSGTDGSTAPPAFLTDADHFTVVRVGAAGSTLSQSSEAVFVEERKLTDGTVTNTINMPIAAAAGQGAFTLRGTGTTEGNLSLSADGKYLLVAGYDTAPATATVATSMAANVPRVVARIDAMNNVDTSTILGSDEFDQVAVRAVASIDGTNFWVSGEGSAMLATGGIHYVPFGAAGAQIYNEQLNLRFGGIFGGQLFASSVSGAVMTRIFSVGTGTPTTAGSVLTGLPGYTSDGTSMPNAFTFLDLDAGVAGIDTLYVADQRSIANGGGIQKWKLATAGGNWSLATTFKTGFTGAPSFVSAKAFGTNVVVMAVTGDNPARIVRFVDDGANLNPTGATVATGTASTIVFRGVNFRPE